MDEINICPVHGQLTIEQIHVANGHRICMANEDCQHRLKSQLQIEAEAMVGEVIREVYGD